MAGLGTLSRVDLDALAKLKAQFPAQATAIDAAIAAGDRAAAARIVRDAKVSSAVGVDAPRIYRSGESPAMGQPSVVQVARPAEPRIYRSGESATFGQPQVTQVGNDTPLPRPTPQPAQATAGEELAGEAMETGLDSGNRAIPPLVSENNELLFEANMDRLRGMYPDIAERMDAGDPMAFDQARSLFRQHQTFGWDAPIGEGIGGATRPASSGAPVDPAQVIERAEPWRTRAAPEPRPTAMEQIGARVKSALWDETPAAPRPSPAAPGPRTWRNLPQRVASNPVAAATAAGVGLGAIQSMLSPETPADLANSYRPLPGDEEGPVATPLARQSVSAGDTDGSVPLAPPRNSTAMQVEAGPDGRPVFPMGDDVTDMTDVVPNGVAQALSREDMAESMPGELAAPPEGHELSTHPVYFDQEVVRRANELGMSPADVKSILTGGRPLSEVSWDELQSNRRQLYGMKQMGRAQDLAERKNRVRQYGIARGMGMTPQQFDLYETLTPEQKQELAMRQGPAMSRSARMGRSGWEWSETPVFAPVDEGGWRRDVARIGADAEMARSQSILDRLKLEHEEKMGAMGNQYSLAMKNAEIQAEANRIMAQNSGITAQAAMEEAKARVAEAAARQTVADATMHTAQNPPKTPEEVRAGMAQTMTREQQMQTAQQAAQDALDEFSSRWLPYQGGERAYVQNAIRAYPADVQQEIMARLYGG